MRRSLDIEELLFPRLMIFSPGISIISSRCTICGAEYGICDHLKGLLYMGEFCAREITEARLQETSIVNTPAG